MKQRGVVIKEMFDPYFKAPLEIWESFASFLKQNSYKKNEVIKEVNRDREAPKHHHTRFSSHFLMERAFNGMSGPMFRK
jgi:hypothetical protein